MIRNLRWGDVAQLKYGKSLREYPESSTENHRFRVFGTNGPIGWHTSPLVQNPGIIIGRKGAYRGVHFSDQPFFVIDTAYYLDIFDPQVDVKWAYYQLLTVDINRMDSGSAIPSTKREDFNAVPVLIPPFEAQKRIADILAAYDDLIENNRRRMALLEESARLLYREWFVRLRFPGHERTHIVDGVPVGWERRPLGGCATFLSGGTPSKAVSEYWDGDIPWVSSGELTALRIHDASLHVTSEAIEAGSRLVPPNTILVVVRGMSLAKEFRMAMTSRHVAFNQDLKALVARSDIDAVYLFHALETQREQIRDRATEASHGTKKLDTPVLASIPILVPPSARQRQFREIVDPLIAQWDNLNQQVQKLRSARDLLLPRLMSGEIAV